MKTIETNLYSYNELSQAAQERVIKREAERINNDPDDFTLSECMDSLKAVANALGVRIKNWSVGPYNRGNHVDVDCDYEGNKALARFLRVLVERGYSRPKTFKAMKFPGVCGFTGVCFDDDVCEEIWDALLDGDTIGKAFDRAGDRIARIAEDDLKYRQTKEEILESLDQTAELYTEAGNEF